MNCLYISNFRENKTGGKIIADRNLLFLTNIFGNERLISYIISHEPTNKIRTLFNILNNQLVKLHKTDQKKISDEIVSKKVDIIFLDNSLLGNVAAWIKSMYPQIKIITFFHNFEYDYFKSFAISTGQMYHRLTARCAKKVEINSVNFSDKIIAMNNRDSFKINEAYGRKPDFLLPTTLEDDFDVSHLKLEKTNYLTLLFVGTRFFPNEEGVRWFVTEVMPKLNKVKLQIVGNGFEDIKNELEKTENVSVVGKVDSLSDYYYQSNIIISPIFSGSGMKTKTAEALKYGKYFLGTDEALEGYDLNENLVGRKCNSRDDFISAILSLQEKTCLFNRDSRNTFLKNYESSVQLANFKKFMNESFKF